MMAQAGCEVRTQCQVQYVLKNPLKDGVLGSKQRRWRVYLDDINFVLSDFVILSAGVFGTTKILFQSQRRGLRASEKLGCGFSGNGNNVAYVAGSRAPLNAYGLRKNQLPNISLQDRPGPAISSSYTSSLGFTVQTGVLPTAYSYLIFKGIVSYGWPPGYWLLHGLIDKVNHLISLKANQAVILNTMGFDLSNGKITLDEKTGEISFTPPEDPLLSRKIQTFQRLAERLGGVLFMSRFRSTSVHLLGGCIAAVDSSSGVCNPSGQVFDTKIPGDKISSTETHPGLYVCDGSLVPCSVGINPSLTIAIIAEHVSRSLVRETLQYKAENPRIESSFFEKSAKKAVNFGKVSVGISETMTGFVGGMKCIAHLKMEMGVAEDMGFGGGERKCGETHSLLKGKVGGYIVIRALERENLYILDGKVDMCSVDCRSPYTQYMHYNLLLVSASGSRYILEGKKIMNPYLLGLYAWKELTNLHITLQKIAQNEPKFRNGNNFENEKVELSGELHVSALELLKSLVTMKGNQRGRFIFLLLRSICRTYILQRPRGCLMEHIQSPNVKQKPYPPSLHHDVITEDRVTISCRQWRPDENIWRWDGERKPYPVLLINGHSTESFWLPTEQRDLVRTLLENGHETWLLQTRLHPLHPSNNFTIEDIAKYDIPAAIDKICEIHGQAQKLHAIAHCVGGLALHMSLLGGHVSAAHFASLSCTNTSMFFKIITSSLVKMWLPLIPMSMAILGSYRTISMFETSKQGWRHSLLKSIACMVPRYERCNSNECSAFSGFFGNTYWHENITPTMHHFLNKESLPRLPMAAFPHLRKICINGFIVNSKGQNVYLAHPERMGLHTLYISGGRTLLVTPETSNLANKYMRLHQPGFVHKRVVVEGFGHSDLLIGEESYKRVFPHFLSHLKTAEGEEGKDGGVRSIGKIGSWECLGARDLGFEVRVICGVLFLFVLLCYFLCC
ncbi:hypothetical protein AMTRI_Chr11g151100 [Amborella trichopoda]